MAKRSKNNNDDLNLSVIGANNDPLLLSSQRHHHHHHQRHESGWTFNLIYSIFAAVLGSLFACGYNAGVVNEPYDAISQFINNSFAEQHSKQLTESELNTQWSIAVSLFLVGAVFGCIWLPEMMADRYGRTRSLLYISPIGAIGNILCFISPYTNSYLPLYFGRLVGGFHCGMTTVILPALLVELPPVNLRGACGSLTELPFLFGVVAANIVALPYILGNDYYWHLLFLIGATFYVAHTVLLFFAAESPRWLVDAKREKEALKTLRKLRKNGTLILSEYEEIKTASAAEAVVERVAFKDFFRYRHLAWPLFLSINLAIAQQMTGLSGILIYSSELLIKGGYNDEYAKIANLGLSFVNIAGTILSMAIIDRVGRRLLFLLGLLGTGISHVILTISLLFNNFYGCIIGLAMFRFTFAVGPGPITWYMPAEMFLQGARPLALSICLFANWLCCLGDSFLFPQMLHYLRDYTFTPFAVLSFVELVVLFLFLPETRGIPVEDVVAKFAPGQPLLQFNRKNDEDDDDKKLKNNNNNLLDAEKALISENEQTSRV